MRLHTVRRALPVMGAVAMLALGASGCSSDDDTTAAPGGSTAGASAPAATDAGATRSGAPATAPGAASGSSAPRGTSSARPGATSQGGQRTIEGVVQYMAPGKYVIGDQAFHVAQDTKILGGAAFCPPAPGSRSHDAQGYGNRPCTEDAFEEAAKSPQSATTVKVVVDAKGVAVSITEKVLPS